MKFSKSQELIDYINELENIYELNLSISDILSAVMGNRNITKKDEINALVNSSNYSEKEILLSKISEYLDIDLSFEDNQYIFDEHIAKSITCLDNKQYKDNPYYQAIKIQNIKDGDLELACDQYQAYEVFPYLDMSCSSNYVEINSLGFFKKDFPFIALNYKGVTWMSITPNEIETMKSAISKVSGNVLVFGLGLGYFAFMAANKEEVHKVTVIEKDHKIINLFNKYLLPQFPNAKKITVIRDDALNYLNKNLAYDYAFIDLWHDPIDGIELYLKFKSLERKQNKCQFLYWLESSFTLYLRRCFISLLLESRDNLPENNYAKSKTVDDNIINKYYFATKNLVINNKVDVDNLLSDKSLINLLLDH